MSGESLGCHGVHGHGPVLHTGCTRRDRPATAVQPLFNATRLIGPVGRIGDPTRSRHLGSRSIGRYGTRPSGDGDARLSFSVLGPLLVMSAGEPVAIPFGRERVVLAQLLARVGRPVTSTSWSMVSGRPAPGERGANTLRSSRAFVAGSSPAGSHANRASSSRRAQLPARRRSPAGRCTAIRGAPGWRGRGRVRGF